MIMEFFFFFLYMPEFFFFFFVEFKVFFFSKKTRTPPLGIKWDAPNYTTYICIEHGKQVDKEPNIPVHHRHHIKTVSYWIYHHMLSLYMEDINTLIMH